MQRKKLPLGIQTLAKIRERDACYYVDKTPLVLQLIAQGSHYFLSRPRRFGKSLLVDTLKELFEGHKALFEGLYAEQHWDWSIQYPVLRLSFGAGMVNSLAELDEMLGQQLALVEQQWGHVAQYAHVSRRTQDLIRQMHVRSGQRVAVLVDEYDKPILDHLSRPELARQMRDALHSLYAVFKESDADLQFVFITGVSKFSKVSLFSGLNNLNDITLDPAFADLCGYTDAELDRVFAPELVGLDRARIRAWYNGYNWRGTSVYNPFDVLLLFQKREFRPFWFETGTPTFLVDFLAERHWFTPDLSMLQSNDSMLSHFDVDHIAPEALLWQTGYLTLHQVTQKRSGNWLYTLGYPNREVESALNEVLLPAYGPPPPEALASRSRLEDALFDADLPALRQSIEALFASIPYEWYRKNPLAQFEGHYASVFYSQLAALGLNVQAEDITSHGRIDLSLRLEGVVYLFEFKVIDDQPTGTALQQLIARDYAAKYKAPDTRIVGVGIEFSKAARNVVGFDTCWL